MKKICMLFLSHSFSYHFLISLYMATTSLHSLHLPHLPRRRRLHHHPSSSINLTLSSSTTTSSSSNLTFDSLANRLSASDFRQADDETRRLLIALAGEAAQKRGYVFFSEVQFIAVDDLRAIDDLWRLHSNGRFGYSVQRRLWEKARPDYTKFFIKVGWMRRMETEVEQFTYRSFPGEFIWELNDETPEGHLPLTNALRGTQLLGGILMHPAFEVGEERDGDESEEEAEDEKGKERVELLSGRRLKPDYSF